MLHARLIFNIWWKHAQNIVSTLVCNILKTMLVDCINLYIFRTF